MVAEKQRHFELLKGSRSSYNPVLSNDALHAITAVMGTQKENTEGAKEKQLGDLHDQILRAQAAHEEGGGAATDTPVLLRMQDTPDFLSIPLDFQGFCVASLVDLGLLIPGSPKLGVIQYKGRYCVFEWSVH